MKKARKVVWFVCSAVNFHLMVNSFVHERFGWAIAYGLVTGGFCWQTFKLFHPPFRYKQEGTK